MKKYIPSLFLAIAIQSCNSYQFRYPSNIVTSSERAQYEKSLWLIYKLYYDVPIFLADSNQQKQIAYKNHEFVECDVLLRGVEKKEDTIIFSFVPVYNNRIVSLGLHEDDGIPKFMFIGNSDSLRQLSNFVTTNFPQECLIDCDSQTTRRLENTNRFIYDTLGNGDFIFYLRSKRFFLSPTLYGLCKKREIEL